MDTQPLGRMCVGHTPLETSDSCGHVGNRGLGTCCHGYSLHSRWADGLLWAGVSGFWAVSVRQNRGEQRQLSWCLEPRAGRLRRPPGAQVACVRPPCLPHRGPRGRALCGTLIRDPVCSCNFCVTAGPSLSVVRTPRPGLLLPQWPEGPPGDVPCSLPELRWALPGLLPAPAQPPPQTRKDRGCRFVGSLSSHSCLWPLSTLNVRRHEET